MWKHEKIDFRRIIEKQIKIEFISYNFFVKKGKIVVERGITERG